MDAKTKEWVDGIIKAAKTDMLKALEDPRALPVLEVAEKELVMKWQLVVEDKAAGDQVVASGRYGYEQPDNRTSWRPLFNGHDLTGWEHVGRGDFAIRDGLLKTEGGMGLLWYTGQMFGDVVIRVVYRNPGGANSGVFIRIPEKPTEPWMPVNRGYEVQIYDHGDVDEYHVTGALYSLTRAAATPVRLDEWNTMEITLDGDRTAVAINGVQVTDYREGQPVPPKKKKWEPDRGPRPRSGYIGLQNHSDEDIVYFREVSVRPLR